MIMLNNKGMPRTLQGMVQIDDKNRDVLTE